MNRKYRIYAVDFDGTLFSDNYPAIGKPNLRLIWFLGSKRKLGDKVILWTCRVGKYLQEAVDCCAEYGLEFDAVNENIPEIVAAFNSESRKVFADIYIDDKSADKSKYHIPFLGDTDDE